MTTPPPSPAALRAAQAIVNMVWYRDTAESDIAAIIDRETAPKWLPIAEAPKGGGLRFFVRFGPQHYGYCYLTQPEEGFMQTWRFASGELQGKQAPWPTHWMHAVEPLHAPPTEPNT